METTKIERMKAFIEEVIKIEDPAEAYLYLWKNFLQKIGSKKEAVLLQSVWQKSFKNWRKDIEKINKGQEIVLREISSDMIKAKKRALVKLCKEHNI